MDNGNEGRAGGILQEFAEFCRDAAARGWHERNGGNVSMVLSAEGAGRVAAEFAQAAPTSDAQAAPAGEGPRRFPLAWPVPELAGMHLLVTATGCFMREVAKRPAQTVGLIRIADGGDAYEVVAGFADGGRATSELPSHLLVHLERLRARDERGAAPASSVVYHAHTPSLIALSHAVEPETAAFTRVLWSTFTECPMFCPAGVGVVGFLIPGSLELARATAELARRHDAVMWALHGVLACGPSLREAYGLVETIEKAADIALRRLADGGPERLVEGGLNAERLIALDEALGLGLDRSLLG